MLNISNNEAVKEMSSSEDKEEHLRLCLGKDVESSMTTGFERFYLINNPLPEMDFHDIDTSCSFLGKDISSPFLVLPMTGGTELSARINRNLAVAAQEIGIPMCVGSQRLAIEDAGLTASYQVRKVAPDIPLLANLGAVYLNYGYGLEECERVVDMIGADGLVLYLNPMQKVFQGTKNLNFGGIVDKISHICAHLGVPVIVKEVGFGLSPNAAVALKDAGVSLLDVAGAGGTSWLTITRYLKDDTAGWVDPGFDDWGIPTADSLISVRSTVEDLPIIASGGIRSGIDMAKAMALGADFSGMALPLLAPAIESSEAVRRKIERTLNELKTAMFCCGTANLEQLKTGACIKKIS